MNEFNFYPEKPEIEVRETKERGMGITVFSIVLFISSMLLLFSDNIFFILTLVAALLLHELGHFTFMKLYKYKNVRMLFVPLMGAFVQGMKEKYSQIQSFLVVLAGPLPGIVLGIVLFLIAQNFESGWMMTISLLLLFLNVLNLLPLDPLDGGQLLKLLIKRNQDILQLTLSLSTSLLLIGGGLLIDSMIMIAMGFFMAFRIRSLQRNYVIRKELTKENILFETTYKDLNNKQYAQIKEVVLRNTPTLKKIISLNTDDEIDPIIASQVQNILVAPLIRDANFLQRVMVILAWIMSFAIPIYLFTNYAFEWYFDGLQSW